MSALQRLREASGASQAQGVRAVSSFVETRPEMTRPVWRHHSPNDKVIVCSVEPTASKVRAITIVLDSESILNECYPGASAIRRVMHVRELLERRGWRVAVDAAVAGSPT